MRSVDPAADGRCFLGGSTDPKQSLGQPFVSAHPRSYRGTEFFWSSQSHCTAASHCLLHPVWRKMGKVSDLNIL